MKKSNKVNEWCRKTAQQLDLSITTVKNAYRTALDPQGKINQEQLRLMLKQAQVNSRKRKNKSTPSVSMLVPSSYLIQQLLHGKIEKHYIYDYDLSDDAKYSHCIYSADEKENLKIYRNEYDKAVFWGTSYRQMLMLSAVYTTIENKLYASISNNDWGDTIYHIQPQTLYQVINAGKRWDKLTTTQKLEFSKIIDSLQELRKLNGRMWVKWMAKAVEDDRGTLLMRCKLQLGKTLDDNLLLVNINPDGLLAAAKKQKRIVAIPPELLDYGRGSIDGALARWYIAYRICIKSQKMQRTILMKTLDGICDCKVSRKMIKGYMQYLADAGFITEYTITRHGISWHLPEIKKQTNSPLIIVHNSDGKLSDNPPEKTDYVKERERTLYIYNEFSSRYDVKLNGRKIDTRLHSTFCNDDWMQGGRLYTSANGYQSLSKADRANLTINGHKVVELDFSSYHPHLLYALIGQQLTSDAYNFYPIRKAAKLALNITINAKNKDAAQEAFKHKWQSLSNTPIDVKHLFAVMEKRHSAIAQYFYSGAGTGLQYIDSCIACKIIMAMRAKRILALPVHDSFIVDARYADRLRQVMCDEYSKYTGGFDCPIAAQRQL